MEEELPITEFLPSTGEKRPGKKKTKANKRVIKKGVKTAIGDFLLEIKELNVGLKRNFNLQGVVTVP